MCESLTDLAVSSHPSFLIPSCSTNDPCDGVRCEVFTGGDTYYIEGVILPCESAVELIVEDEDLEQIFSTRFNESGRRDIVIAGFPITVNSSIIPREYSMDIAVRT